jgi:colanic acid biosynthesis protein WcaH
MLHPRDLHTVIRHTPIASVDILYLNNERILLGKRQNKPAKDTLFNPGAKIWKHETIENALLRVTESEVGLKDIEKNRFKFHTVTQHIYPDNFLDDSFGTHYISISYVIHLTDKEASNIIPDEQHDQLKWYNIVESVNHPEIHPYCA